MRQNIRPQSEEDTQIASIQRPNKMRLARLKKGLSQAQMAHLVKTTQPTYSRIENGFTQQPDEEILRRIAEFLKIPIDDLSTNEALETSPPKMEQTETALNPKDIPAVIHDLKELLDDGAITDAQFTEKRKELLARL